MKRYNNHYDGHRVRTVTLILIGLAVSSVLIGGVMGMTYLYNHLNQ